MRNSDHSPEPKMKHSNDLFLSNHLSNIQTCFVYYDMTRKQFKSSHLRSRDQSSVKLCLATAQNYTNFINQMVNSPFDELRGRYKLDSDAFLQNAQIGSIFSKFQRYCDRFVQVVDSLLLQPQHSHSVTLGTRLTSAEWERICPPYSYFSVT